MAKIETLLITDITSGEYAETLAKAATKRFGAIAKINAHVRERGKNYIQTLYYKAPGESLRVRLRYWRHRRGFKKRVNEALQRGEKVTMKLGRIHENPGHSRE